MNTIHTSHRYEVHSEYMPEDWRKIHQGHACYTPGKVWTLVWGSIEARGGGALLDQCCSRWRADEKRWPAEAYDDT